MGQEVSADLVAHAVIAAARVYGIEPIHALTSKGGLPRRPITAAGHAIARATGCTERRIGRILRVGPCAISAAKNANGDAFWKASVAAQAAIRAHLGTTPEPALRQTAGPISSIIRPSVARGPPPEPAGTLRGRILATLNGAGSSAPNLAILVDAKEQPISQTLRNLEREGVVVAGPVPQQGERHRNWSLAKQATA